MVLGEGDIKYTKRTRILVAFQKNLYALRRDLDNAYTHFRQDLDIIFYLHINI